MGFVPQPNDWQCGPYALKHALLTLGIVADASELTRRSGAGKDGADERDLARAARRHGCELVVERHYAADAAVRALRARTRARIPVLLCVEGWTHWIVATAAEDVAVVLDSREREVFRLLPLPVLGPALAYRAAAGRIWYDLHPLMPVRARTHPGRFSAARVLALREPGYRELSGHWGRYVASLAALSRAPGPQLEWAVSVGTLLREYAATLLRAGTATPSSVRTQRTLAHAAFVADTHDLMAAPEQAEAVRGAVMRLMAAAAAA